MGGRRAINAIVVAVAGCHGCAPRADSATGGGQAAPPPESEAPVALNPNVPIAYPPALFDQKVEGDVTLRLFVDSTGKLIPERTGVPEPGGYPALDPGALAGGGALRFAPAKRHGIPVATAFLQPVEFRQVGTTRAGGGTVTLPPPAAPTPLPPPAAAPVRRRPRPVTPTPPPTQPTPPQPVPADTTREDTNETRSDTSGTTHL